MEPVFDPLPEPEPEPPVRPRLLAEALEFVRAARGLPGVRRIALLGSLATDREWPKDVDLLVTVEDGVDLAPLAKLARRLQGHAQSMGLGADVFLADPAGRYLGRTCPWSRCGPGIRASCDALHCGRRAYLHDDLETVHLADDLVAAPPVDLWPAVLARVAVPDDVREGLVSPVAADRPAGTAT
ncbi:MAG: nucleotidyltransferase domain-containing protein [Actinobacteria bacterium]|nr:nucleotidyltransferase domain-containing protein [Actinomycetota bacterium]